MRRVFVSLLVSCLFSVAAAFSALGADATAFNPTLVAVKAKGSGGVPVGTIISWPVATDPEDMDNWLECNGQSISQSAYPELFALMGANVPDLRGLFLRGHGGKSAGLHQRQTSTVHVPASAGVTINLQGIRRGSYEYEKTLYAGDNAFMMDYCSPSIWGPMNGIISGGQMSIPFTIISPAQETRPENMAVRYLIRARP